MKHNEPWGPELIELKPDDIFRLYFQNVKGLRIGNNGLDILDYFCHMKSIGADIFGANEINVDTNHPLVQRLLRRHSNQVWEHSRIQTSSSQISFNSTRKPGGTLLGVTGNTTGRVMAQYSDPMGRFSSLTLLGRMGKHITVISSYQVPKNSNLSGPTTAHTQQVLQLKRHGIPEQNPRRQFCAAIDIFLKEKIELGHQIILGGDFNEELGSSMQGFAYIVAKHNLTDVLRVNLGTSEEPATYSRGTKRLDYIFMTSDIASSVVSCGAEPFNHRFFSDHRGLYVDLKLSGIFDRNLSPLASPQFRDIRSGNPHQIQKYIRALSKGLNASQIPMRTSQLKLNPNNADAEQLDTEITDAMLAAGKVCAHTSRLPVSPELHSAQTQLRIYQKLVSQFRTNRDMSIQINKKQQQLNEPIPLPNDLKTALRLLRSAQREVRNLSRQAYQLKDKYRAATADALARSDNACAKKALARIQRAEATKEMFQRLPRSKPRPTGGLSLIKIPLSGPLVPEAVRQGIAVTEPIDIEEQLLRRNRQHFSQARKTPFATEPLKSIFNWQGTSPATDNVLKGCYPSHEATNDGTIYDITSTSTKILQSCQRRLADIPPGLDPTEMKRAYRAWRESTSTSPSGRHLGHYHALLKPDGLTKDSEEAGNLAVERDEIWKIHHTMFEYGLSHAHCYTRWKNVVNAMIEKEPGNPWIHRLRVIHLYENDYNLLIGSQYRKAVHQAEDAEAINDGNFGGRTARSSLDPIGIELLQYEYSQLLRLRHLKFSNDATACYDRIVVNLASIISRSFGLHRNITTVHGDMLQHAIYRIKTKMGISDGFYQHSDDCPVFGTGQGSRSSPPIWNFNSSVYFDTFDKLSYGAKYYSISGERLLIGMTGFVDDNNCNCNEDAITHESDSNALMARMRHDAQLWHDILWTSGGALELTKCQFHLMSWNHTVHGDPILETGLSDQSIDLESPFGEKLCIRQLGCGQSYKTLGAFVEPLQHQQTQYRYLLNKGRLHTRLLSSSSCKYNHAWVYYFSVFLRSIGYGLPICHLTKNQLTEIQKPMTPVLLTKLGVCQNTSRHLCFLSSYYGGLDLRDLYIEQGCGQIEFILRHLRSPGMTGALLKIVMGWFQFNAGVSYPVFAYPALELPHLEGKWLCSVRRFLHSIHGSLDLNDNQIQPPQRLHDQYLMDLALPGPFSSREIRGINLCRLYFNALLLSDITNANGTRILPGIHDGTLLASQSKPSGPKVKQPTPDLRAWTAWRKLLRQVSNFHGQLHAPLILGSWSVSGQNLRRIWPFLHSPSVNVLYRSQPNTYEVLPPIRCGVYNYAPGHTTPLLPIYAIPVDCIERRDGWCILTLPTLPEEETIEFAPSWSEYVTSLPEWESMLLQRVDFQTLTPLEIYDRLSEATSAILVSDGAADHLQGAAGWVVAIGAHRIAKGQCPVPGYDPRSYRAEGYGMIAGLLFLRHLCRFCGHLNLVPLQQMFCDNLGLVTKVNKLFQFRLAPAQAALHSEYDVLATIRELLSDFVNLPSIAHVKGHQDNKVAYANLPLPAQLNCDADVLATHELFQFPTTCEHVPLLPAAQAQLSIGGRTVTRKLAATIRRQHSLRLLKTYMSQRFQWTNNTIESVNWEAFSCAFRSRYQFKTFTFKLCYWLLPTGSIIHRRTPRFDSKCPACNHLHECNDHMFQCPAVSRRKWRSSFMLSTRHHAESETTDPILVHILLAGIKSYFNEEPFPLHECRTYSEPYLQLIHQQIEIGWGHLIRGRFSSTWADLQHDYSFRTQPSLKFDPAKWYRKVVNPMLVDCHALWTLRNGERHGTERQQKKTKRLEQLERDLQELYQYEPEVLAADRNLFDTAIDDLLTMQPGDITKWIVSRRPIILQSRREANRRNLNHVRLLPTYFHPLTRRHTTKKSCTRLTKHKAPIISITAPLITAHFRRIDITTLRRRRPIPSPSLVQRPILTQQSIQFPDDVI
jgi:hypothetical protein